MFKSAKIRHYQHTETPTDPKRAALGGDKIMAIASEAVEVIGNDRVPESYRGFFDNADWTLHSIVVQGSWIFLILAIVVHFLAIGALH